MLFTPIMDRQATMEISMGKFESKPLLLRVWGKRMVK
jgi:hypothetical protein